MGASLGSPVQVNVVVRSLGNKLLKCKLVQVCDKSTPLRLHSIGQYFKQHVLPTLQDPASKCGDLLQVMVILRERADEVEVGSLEDSALMYAQMGLNKVTFYVEQPDVLPVSRPERDVVSSLVRERQVELPTWVHADRPALSHLFSSVRERMNKDAVGFTGALDLKMGCEWMLSLTHVLYKLSPFHAKLKMRNCPMPAVFSFSSGADDFKKKGRSEPLMTQELLEEVRI